MARRIVHARIDRDFVLGHDASEVLDPLFCSVRTWDGPEAYEASLARFSRPQRLALAVFWYDAEVNNGGHSQFFSNSTGGVWKDALAGLEMLELPSFAAVLHEAAARLGGDPPLEWEPRRALLDADDERFDDLDERFDALQRGRDLWSALTDWMHAHPDRFTFEGVYETV